MSASWWERFKPFSAYRSECGGWCVRIWRAYFHVTGLFRWERI